MKQQLVKDWMTRDVVTITPDMTLPEAHRIMTDKQIRRLPVVEDNHLVGIVTRSDVRGAEPSEATTLSIWEINYLLAKLKIRNIMTADPVTVSQDVVIGDAAKIMLEYKLSGLPVVDDAGVVIGIITESDIFRLVVRTWHVD